MQKKYEAAVRYFDKEDYTKSLTLFEELVSVYKGTARAEEVLYYYAYSHYNLGDYILAGYHFKTFVRNFPSSKHIQECAYMVAYCHYLNSPTYSLDQSSTKEAMKELQLFINLYSVENTTGTVDLAMQSKTDSLLKSANEMIVKLRHKLELKSFDNARLYYRMLDYSAAVASFNIYLKEFPDASNREEASFLIVKSNYLYAENSVEQKKAERYQAAIDAFFKYRAVFPQGDHYKEAEEIYTASVAKKDRKPKP